MNYPEPRAAPRRRTYLRRDARRDQILDCALAVFARKGFHETSIADICARARIARGTLYQYFTNKRGVLAALIDRIVCRVLDAIQHWPSLERSPDVASTEANYVAFVQARCRQIMDAVFADADTASLILRMARGTGFMSEALARIDQQVVGVIAADVRTHMDWGVLRPFDPQLVAEFIVGGIEKIVIQALDDGRAIDVPCIARELAVLVSRGLLPADPCPPPRSRAPGGPPLRRPSKTARPRSRPA
jgi:TetR/AcrR family transcriptional regulator, fatty acid metabolism regulator protein